MYIRLLRVSRWCLVYHWDWTKWKLVLLKWWIHINRRLVSFADDTPIYFWSHWAGFFLLRLVVVVGEGKGDSEKASLAHPGKKTKKAPKATKYRVSKEQCTLSVSAPEDYESSKFRTAPAGWGKRGGKYPSHQVMQISPGTVGLFRWCPVCQVQLWVASL